jgi:hypothetical protein
MNGVFYVVLAEMFKKDNWVKSSERVVRESVKRRLSWRS